MSKKLLLADDSITIQKVIQIIFAHEEYELTITGNGDAALEKAQEIKPDLVMSDVYMPGLNGYELTAAIKQDPALQHVPVLLLAGSFEPFDEDKARSCKADAWIEKPFESQSLIDKVAELLDAASGASAAPEAPAAVAEAVTAPEPAAVEAPLAAFDDETEEVTALPDDPFGDISFDEETSETEPEKVAVADDWSDVAVEAEVSAPVFEEADAAAEEPAAEAVEDFSFAEEETVAVETAAPVEEVLAADVDLDVFDMGHEEIMPLGDDDILDAEDLEPVMPEQTLAAWSRTEVEDEEVFAESSQEFSTIEDDEIFETPVAEEPPAFVTEEPAVDEASVFDDSIAETFTEEASVARVAEVEPTAVTAAMVDVDAKVSAMSEEDVEKIIEKVVTQVVEKLAGSILERVAWEVVPDLAESLIREEIRKIKDAAA